MIYEQKACYYVGIGASAGGTEALLSFFENIPNNTGFVYIIAQHLSPDFKTLMPELLSRNSHLSIQTIKDGLFMTPNTIYLLPPEKTLTIEAGHFVLSNKKEKPLVSYPIDILFQSLAMNYKDKAIAVVLSGCGSDGTQGIQSISKNGGIILVQSPEDSQFSSMPENAIATNLVNYVLPVERISELIVRFSNDPKIFNTKLNHKVLRYNAEHEQLFNLLFQHFKVDFNQYKAGTILRRIDRKMQALNFNGFQEYIAYLQNNEEELNLLYKDLLIGVTLFFRDPEAFDVLEKKVIPLLFEKQQQTNTDIRVWCAACATGEEAYSLAILLYEYAEKNKLPLKIKLYATDINTDFLTTASRGIYSPELLKYVSKKRRDHYFIQQNKQYKIIKPIRDMVIFAPHNLLVSPPFFKMDLICCRNFLIYVQPLIQKKILSLLHFGLNIPGYLFLGPSESLGDLAQFVEPITAAWNIYKKTSIQPNHLLFNPNGSPLAMVSQQIVPSLSSSFSSHIDSSSLPIYVYQEVLKDLIPCGFIIDESHRILHVYGRAGEFIFYQEGVAKLGISSLIISDLQLTLKAALFEAKKNRSAQAYKDIKITNNKGEIECVNLIVKPISSNNQIHYYCICIELNDASVENEQINQDTDNSLLSKIHSLEDSLQQTRESLRNSIDEFKTMNEELLASNEELQATNEELQSVNEVLFITNNEHQRKMIELSDARSSIGNLLRSTDVGALFLDKSLKIRMFTPVIAQFFNLIESDAGRLINGFVFKANFQELIIKLKWVIKHNCSFEKEIEDADGHWYLLRIFPYLNNGQDLDGAIVTMTNINEVKQAKIKLDETEAKLNLALKSSHIGLWRLDFKSNIMNHDKTISVLFGLPANKKIKTYKALEQHIFLDDRVHSRQLLEQAKISESHDFYMEFRVLWPDKTMHYIVSRGHIYKDKEGVNSYLTGVCWDMNDHMELAKDGSHISK